jgi:hypothetical protein
MHLEVDEITPVRHPLIKERAIFCFHQLITTIELSFTQLET